ncbi:MAG: pentapeptide repeat-containing protein [Nostoc sp. ZfuVER08]|nr:hypothetical protein [Nostoc sp. GBBB01]
MVCVANRSTNRLGFSVYASTSHSYRSNLLPIKQATATPLKRFYQSANLKNTNLDATSLKDADLCRAIFINVGSDRNCYILA